MSTNYSPFNTHQPLLDLIYRCVNINISSKTNKLNLAATSWENIIVLWWEKYASSEELNYMKLEAQGIVVGVKVKPYIGVCI